MSKAFEPARKREGIIMMKQNAPISAGSHLMKQDPSLLRAGILLGPCIALLVSAAGCTAFYPPLPVVESVELERYVGKWYEIARYPNSFETGCVGVTAEYEIRSDGRINVLNTCIEGDLDGPVRTIEGRARVADPTTNAKLKVTFFWPFEGDYWILELGEEEDYGYAVVGEPSRKFFWILSRTPTLDEATFDSILAQMPDLGYDPDRLLIVEQDAP
jgi:apolipoprotein D and lipocalin family protein